MKNNSIYFTTFGCKVNQAEANEIIPQLNCPSSTSISRAKFVIVNCCSVTTNTLSKISKTVNKSLKQDNIKKIYLIGCINNTLKNKYQNFSKVEIISDSYKKFDIINKFKNYSFNQCEIKNRTRAFVKIHDGCNNFCSYCIVPYLRYKPYSVPIKQVLKKIEETIKKGFKEIVLCGISLGNYGDDLNENNYLYKLLKEITRKIKNEIRIRLTSINPDKINIDLIKLILNENIFCNHIHLPLQSGSDKILKLMKRRYDTSQFLKVINSIKSINEYTGITTDVIVGFPGENEKDFQNTVKLISNIKFLRTHIFSYSDRKITAAEQIKPKLKQSVIKKRHNYLTKKSTTEANKFLNKFLNKNLTILIENNSREKKFNGYSSEYIMCSIKNLEHIKTTNIFYTGKAKRFYDNLCIVG